MSLLVLFYIIIGLIVFCSSIVMNAADKTLNFLVEGETHVSAVIKLLGISLIVVFLWPLVIVIGALTKKQE